MVSGPNLGRFGRRRTTRGGAGVGSFRGDKRDKLRRAVLGRFPRVSPDLRLGRDGRPHHGSYRTDRQQAIQLVVEQGLAVFGRLGLRGLGRLLLRRGCWRRWWRGLHFCVRLGAAAGVRGSRCYVVPGRPWGGGSGAAARRGGGARGPNSEATAPPPDLDGWPASGGVRGRGPLSGVVPPGRPRLAWSPRAGEAAPSSWSPAAARPYAAARCNENTTAPRRLARPGTVV